MGVSDIVHELKFLFFNGFVVLIPNLSLLRKQCLSLRELSQPLKERGIYIGGFTCSRLHKKTGFPRL